MKAHIIKVTFFLFFLISCGGEESQSLKDGLLIDSPIPETILEPEEDSDGQYLISEEENDQELVTVIEEQPQQVEDPQAGVPDTVGVEGKLLCAPFEKTLEIKIHKKFLKWRWGFTNQQFPLEKKYVFTNMIEIDLERRLIVLWSNDESHSIDLDRDTGNEKNWKNIAESKLLKYFSRMCHQ